jgi:3'-phosphoadenosine 5'-phosphosulfate sulfotransferase (PAPS reductase)/FAD synthetase
MNEVNLRAYDWVVINSSGGKDSQTAIEEVVGCADRQSVPRKRLVVAHANLGRAEWGGTTELAETQAKWYGLRFMQVSRPQGDLLQHVRDRRRSLDEQGRHDTPAWFSPTERFCTSDHKRGQIAKLLTQLANEWLRKAGYRKQVKILNCLGMRAQESKKRAKLRVFGVNAHQTNRCRLVHDWLPIHGLTEKEVWARIKTSGVPYHRAYDLGMPRLSCCFCIFAPRDALLLAGHHNVALLRDYVKVEKEVRSTFKMGLALADVLKDVEAGVVPASVKNWEM